MKAFVEAKDQSAFETLVRRHENKVFGLAFRMLGNRPDALDATQNVYITLFRKAHTFRQKAAFSTWLYRLTANTCHDLGRGRARLPVPSEGVERVEGRALGETDTSLAVQQALMQLLVEQREAVVMRDIYQMSYEEISGACGVPVGTVKSRISRGRLALAEVLRPEGNTADEKSV